MQRTDLLRNPGYWISKIQMSLYKELKYFMEENNLNQTQLAKRIGVSKGYISQVLNGEFNYKLSTFVELSMAINKVPEIGFTKIDDVIGREDSSKVLKINFKAGLANNEEVFEGKTESMSVNTKGNNSISFDDVNTM